MNKLPNKSIWTHSGLARQIDTDRKTVRAYLVKVAVVIPDFKGDLYHTSNGDIAFNMPLNAYQAWVLALLISKGKDFRETAKGLAIHNLVRDWAMTNAEALSKSTWETQNTTSNKAA